MLDKLPVFWKRYFPKFLHEPLFSCGVCVTSVWGIVFVLGQWVISTFVPHEYQLLANIPFYIIAMCGICALVDRAVKFFEYGYKYTGGVVPFSDYSYLNKFEFRDSLYDCFLKAAVDKDLPIIEIGGETQSLKSYSQYVSLEKNNGNNAIGYQMPRDKFVLIKGLAFEGNFDYLLEILKKSNGFIIEASVAGESGKQIQWILDKFNGVIKLPYTIELEKVQCPEHCGGNINNRIILIQPVN